MVNGAPVDAAAAGTDVAVVLNQTPFYGESGGQVGDTGVISGADGLRIAVTDTQKKLGDLFVHLGRVEAGEARVGTPVLAEVDHARRTAHPRAPLRDASAARGAAPAAGHARGAEGQPERARPAALRRQPAASDHRRGHRLGGSRGERAHPRERRGRHAPDDPGRRGRDGRDGAVRREVRRGGARRLDGPRRKATSRPSRSSCAAARMCARTGDIGYFKIVVGERGRRRSASHRGGDRCVRRGGGGRDAAPAERGRGRIAGGPLEAPERVAALLEDQAEAGASGRRVADASWQPAAVRPKSRR